MFHREVLKVFCVFRIENEAFSHDSLLGEQYLLRLLCLPSCGVNCRLSGYSERAAGIILKVRGCLSSVIEPPLSLVHVLTFHFGQVHSCLTSIGSLCIEPSKKFVPIYELTSTDFDYGDIGAVKKLIGYTSRESKRLEVLCIHQKW